MKRLDVAVSRVERFSLDPVASLGYVLEAGDSRDIRSSLTAIDQALDPRTGSLRQLKSALAAEGSTLNYDPNARVLATDEPLFPARVRLHRRREDRHRDLRVN